MKSINSLLFIKLSGCELAFMFVNSTATTWDACNEKLKLIPFNVFIVVVENPKKHMTVNAPNHKHYTMGTIVQVSENTSIINYTSKHAKCHVKINVFILTSNFPMYFPPHII